MLKALLLASLLPQQLEVLPYPAECGAEIIVRVRNQAGIGLAGAAVRRDGSDAASRPVGVTDDRGELRLVGGDPGRYVFRTAVDGVDLVAPHVVVPARGRWPYVLVAVPLGLALGWSALRRRPTGALR